MYSDVILQGATYLFVVQVQKQTHSVANHMKTQQQNQSESIILDNLIEKCVNSAQ